MTIDTAVLERVGIRAGIAISPEKGEALIEALEEAGIYMRPETAESIEHALERAGIHMRFDEVETMLLEAIEEMPVARQLGDPRDELPPSDVEALARGGFQIEPIASSEHNPLARTLTEYTALLASSWKVADVARMLDVDSSRIRQRLAARTLLGIKSGSSWRIPRFQFEEGEPVPGIEEVFPRLDPELHPTEVYRWFVSPNVDLVVDDQPVSPRDWLLSGLEASAVAVVAEDL